MAYTVIVRQGIFRKTKLVGIVTDGWAQNGARFFQFADNRAVEFPSSCVFEFSRGRLDEIQEQEKRRQEEKIKTLKAEQEQKVLDEMQVKKTTS